VTSTSKSRGIRNRLATMTLKKKTNIILILIL